MTELVFFLFNLVFGGALLWAVKFYIERNQQHLDERLSALTKGGDAVGERCSELEKDFLRLRAELPVDYVRREDWIRLASVLEGKLDRLNDKIDHKA